ncbi:MAG: YidH family protein [Pirellulaceae bacterium]|jgi:putative membrane protein
MSSYNEEDDPRVELALERTEMANFRTQLALDRTTLAWIRTALTFATFGFGLISYFRSLSMAPVPAGSTLGKDYSRLLQEATIAGRALLIVGIVSMGITVLSHWGAIRRLRSGKPPHLHPWPLSIIVALLVAIMGIGGLWLTR